MSSSNTITIRVHLVGAGPRMKPSPFTFTYRKFQGTTCWNSDGGAISHGSVGAFEVYYRQKCAWFSLAPCDYQHFTFTELSPADWHDPKRQTCEPSAVSLEAGQPVVAAKAPEEVLSV